MELFDDFRANRLRSTIAIACYSYMKHELVIFAQGTTYALLSQSDQPGNFHQTHSRKDYRVLQQDKAKKLCRHKPHTEL